MGGRGVRKEGMVTALRSKQTLSVGGTSRSQLSLDIIRAVTPRGGFYPINHQQLISAPPSSSQRTSVHPPYPLPPKLWTLPVFHCSPRARDRGIEERSRGG